MFRQNLTSVALAASLILLMGAIQISTRHLQPGLDRQKLPKMPRADHLGQPYCHGILVIPELPVAVLVAGRQVQVVQDPLVSDQR